MMIDPVANKQGGLLYGWDEWIRLFLTYENNPDYTNHDYTFFIQGGNMEFVNRKPELTSLEKTYRAPGFQFLPVYGRRRIGKTRLIQEFVKDKASIYFLADSVSESEQLKLWEDWWGNILMIPFWKKEALKTGLNFSLISRLKAVSA